MTAGSVAGSGTSADARPADAGDRVGGPRTVRALRAATRWTASRPESWPIALAAFLARGGLVAVALPFLVLPTPIGVAAFVGADALTAAGPTVRFLLVAAGVGLAGATAAAAGTVPAAVADRAILRGWARDRRVAPVRPIGGAAAMVARVLAVRVVAAIPPLLAVLWAIPRISDAAYRELTLPDDLATPFVLRVVVAAPEAVVLVIAALLVGELVAGLATVHVVVDGRGAARSLARLGPDLVRRPAPVLVSFVVGVAALLAGLGLPIAAGVATWGLARRTLASADGLPAAFAAAAAFVATIVTGLVVAGAVGAWRRASLAEAVRGIDRP